jgi:membrane-bound ClpP family serine protease
VKSILKMELLWSVLKYALLTIFSAYAIIFGITVLISSYQLQDPFKFVMTFFSSNLIILIGLVPVVGFVFKIYQKISNKNRGDENGHQESIHRPKD